MSATWPITCWQTVLFILASAAIPAHAANLPATSTQAPASTNSIDVDEKKPLRAKYDVRSPSDRAIAVRFESQTQDGLTVELKADYPSIDVKPGAPIRMYFFLSNLSNEQFTVSLT